MNLSEVCSDSLVTTLAGTTVIEVAKLMRDQHVGAVVVMSDTMPRKPIGIVTDRDIVIRMVAYAAERAIMSIDQVMTTQLTTAVGTTGVHEALEIMRDNGVRRLLVMNGHGEPKGIASFDDLTLVVAQELGTIAQTVATSLLREEKKGHR